MAERLKAVVLKTTIGAILSKVRILLPPPSFTYRMQTGNFHKKLTRFSWIILAVVFILWGIFALFTPLTPASWLFLVGLIILLGRKKTNHLLTKLVGEKWFAKLRLDRLLKSLSRKIN